MGTPVWAVPVGVLCGIIIVGMVVLWWWFPRAWQKGINTADAEIDAQAGPGAGAREAQRVRNRAIIERYTRARARERGEVVPNDDDLESALAGGEQGPPPYAAARQPTMATGQTYVAN